MQSYIELHDVVEYQFLSLFEADCHFSNNLIWNQVIKITSFCVKFEQVFEDFILAE